MLPTALRSALGGPLARTFGSLLTDTIGRLDTRMRQARPVVGLARLNSSALRAYMRYRGAIEEGLGVVEAEAYGELVLGVAKVDGDLARVVALTLPDQLARIAPERRTVYFRLMREVLAVRPTALPLIARTLPDLLPTMEDEPLRAFVARGLALHATSHQKAESFLRQESNVGQAAARELERGISFAEVSRTLTLYARAHCGEDVQVKMGTGTAFSDGHHVYLPQRVDRYGDERDFLVYRVQTALGAGYLEFGTFDLHLEQVPGAWPDRNEGEADLERFFRTFLNRSLARDLFQILEDARIEAKIREAYPGVARDIDRLGLSFRGDRPEPTAPAARAVEALARASWKMEPLPLDPAVAAAIAPLLAMLPDIATLEVGAIAAAVAKAYPGVDALMLRAKDGRSHEGNNANMGRQRPGPEGELPQPEPLFQPPPLAPQLRPEQAGGDERRIEEEAQRLLDEMRRKGEELSPSEARRQARDNERRESESYEDMEAFLERNPAPGGAVVDDRSKALETPRTAAPGVPVDPDVTGGAKVFVYREWDAAIEDYKPRWVTVREQRLKEGSREFVDDVMARERRHVDALRRRFEALRPQGLVKHRGLVDGEDLDIDRVVEAQVAMRIGQQPSDRLYIRRQREERDVAVAFLLDMSSSTNESADGSHRRIIDVEKQALIVAAEALNALGDAFAIWGFSGYGRDHVAFYVAKEFNEPYDDKARERIGRMTFKMENRDGAAIRHATKKLLEQPARVRLLFLLSDGKPLDCGCDHYYDRYAQDDTRAALREARKLAIHPFCVTVDPTGPAYLARMYGEVAYTVIDRLDALPDRLMRVYTRLATSGNRT